MNHKGLAHNTLMLYLLTGSNYLFGLVTVPYLTRVLGADSYSAVGFGMSFSSMIQMLVDFGFQLSGTIDIASSEGDHQKIQDIVSAITSARIALAVVSLGITVCLWMASPTFSDLPLLLLYLAYAVLNSLTPEYLYRALEQMTVVTIRSVVLKAVFVALVFALVHEPGDYLLVPLCYVAGSAVALVAVLRHMHRELGYSLSLVGPRQFLGQFIRSFPFFASRVAGSVFSSANAIVLRGAYPTGPVVGQYSAANNIISAGRQAITPVTGSFFPYVVRTKDFRLLRRALVIGEVVLVGGCVVVGLLSEPICLLIFGEGFEGSALMLRLLLPLVPITLVSYLCGWSGLCALGLDNITNASTFVGAAIQLVGFALFWLTGGVTAVKLCMLTVLSEGTGAAVRCVAFVIGVRKSRKGR